MDDIALLQSYFAAKGMNASWDHIVQLGLQCVLDELEARNWQTACQVLKNLVGLKGFIAGHKLPTVSQ